VLGAIVFNIYYIFSSKDLTAILSAYIVRIKAIFTFTLASLVFTILLALIILFKKLSNYNSKKIKKKVVTI
ncbi:hypothetical protein K432DRAFT_309842, partial [Lepidopterella palustris CBS 459.81]